MNDLQERFWRLSPAGPILILLRDRDVVLARHKYLNRGGRGSHEDTLRPWRELADTKYGLKVSTVRRYLTVGNKVGQQYLENVLGS